MILNDHAARVAALTDLETSLLVEAGAGSGKTALLAGRVVSLLASGVDPRNIAAVTFTEMAASELLGRIHDFVTRLLAGESIPDLEAAFGKRPGAAQLERLDEIEHRIGEITCTTIHGFCQRLLKPYPVEANIDPGAKVLPADDSRLVFEDVFSDWIRARLSGHDPDEDVITALVHYEGDKAIGYIRMFAELYRSTPDLAAAPASIGKASCRPFIDAVEAFRAWCAGLGYEAEGNADVIDAFSRAAQDLATIDDARPHMTAVKVATIRLGSAVSKADGGFKQYRFKGKWTAAAPDKKSGEAANEAATAHYEACANAMTALREAAAAAGVAMLEEALVPLLDSYRKRKRDGAFLDFEDLLVKTREMLSDPANRKVREELGKRFSHILVDEFQDTDPVQSEIFRLLTSDGDGWNLRPGSIFLVGDPKQAIYKFRGADIDTYSNVKKALLAHNPAAVLQVSTNFRSRKEILDYVNAVFEEPLSTGEQPGFTKLDAFRAADGNAAVTCYDIGEFERIAEAREFEAETVSKLCRSLIGTMQVFDKEQGRNRPCEARDIALLAPVGTELRIYEDALEEGGISVATQAGKGMFNRQEVQDVIALTRVLADPRDRLALGALLRGPLVGLTEEELLDESANLPPQEDGSLSFIHVGMDLSTVSHPVLLHVMEVLASLRARAEESTPYALLADAVDLLDVRPTVKARSTSPERTLANVDRYMEMSRPYSVRGLRAFSDDMRKSWEEGEREVEGRPDSQEDSVSLITMHSAKGLEWPVVIPINTMTEFMRQKPEIVDTRTGKLSAPFLGHMPTGYLEEKQRYAQADQEERARLWYVAATRARDLLVLPRHAKARDKTWSALVDLKTDALDQVSFEGESSISLPLEKDSHQDLDAFIRQAAAIECAKTPVRWEHPSRHEHSHALSSRLTLDELIDAVPDMGRPDPATEAASAVQGGAERGEILHKLVEEVLTQETADSPVALVARATELSEQYRSWKPSEVILDPEEIAGTVLKALSLPEVARLRPFLVPEVPSYGSRIEGVSELAVAGVIDAVERRLDDRRMGTVIDWKSDVKPNAAATEAYSEQVKDYLRMNGLRRGLIVYMTVGKTVEVLLEDDKDVAA